ncbi:MAG: hypothetical protein JSU63_06810, partial [Phycisphaerales bacterium]
MSKADQEHGLPPNKAEVSDPDTSAESVGDRSKLETLAKKYDECDMAKVIERLPAQIEIALEQEIPRLPAGPFNEVVIAGMGGSALPMDVLADAFSEQLTVPISVWRQYDLPSSAHAKCLFIASSFSGGTEEVLSALELLPSRAKNVVVLCREDEPGGKQAELARLGTERGYPVIRIPVSREPEGFQPRSAIGYTVTFLARILSDAGILANPQTELAGVPAFLRKVEIRPEAEGIAAWLANRIPAVYTDERHLTSIARVTKIKFNENSKRPALFNALPEANHNEMIGFRNKDLGKFGLLYLHDPESHPRIRRRFNVMRELFEREGMTHAAFREWEMPGTTKVQRIFAALAFAEWCSYTLALLDGLDPT